MIKNCYFPKSYHYISTEYGYDIYEKVIKEIIESNEYSPYEFYVDMIIKRPEQNAKDAQHAFERMFESDNGYSYDWEFDWCEGETDVCILGIFTTDFLEEICHRYSVKYTSNAGGWYSYEEME